jgi:hypothetical protein
MSTSAIRVRTIPASDHTIEGNQSKYLGNHGAAKADPRTKQSIHSRGCNSGDLQLAYYATVVFPFFFFFLKKKKKKKPGKGGCGFNPSPASPLSDVSEAGRDV